MKITTTIEKTQPIYLLSLDVEESLLIARQLMHYGCIVRTINTADKIDSVFQEQPLAILIDQSFAINLRNQGIVIADQFANLHCPIIFIANNGEYKTRLQAFKDGVHAYFTKPIDTYLLAERIKILTNTQLFAAYKILIVVDDKKLVKPYTDMFTEAGLEIEIETDPTLVLNKMQQFNPDLLIIDFYNSVADFSSLVKIIRHHQSFVTLPIIMISNENTLLLQFPAHGINVDEVLVKPVEDMSLLDFAINSVQLTRYMLSSMEKDNLTGLFVHRKIIEYLDSQLSISLRYNRPLCYAIIDLDNFKEINDKYGHAAGDNVLIALGSLLRNGVRASDFVGRFGGEEFVIIFPETTEEAAFLALERLRKEFAEAKRYTEDKSFKVTFSAGLVSSLKYHDIHSLMAKADAAMYLAKNNGRNQVIKG